MFTFTFRYVVSSESRKLEYGGSKSIENASISFYRFHIQDCSNPGHLDLLLLTAVNKNNVKEKHAL